MVTNKKDPMMVLAPLDHIGVVVNDVDQAVAFYSSVFGWGPFKIREATAMKDVNYRGQKASCRLKNAVAKLGSAEIELIQVLEGECPQQDFIRRGRQGLHHLAFRVENLDLILSQLAKDGIEPIWNKDFGFMSFAYLNSDQYGGMIVELMEYRKPASQKSPAPQ